MKKIGSSGPGPEKSGYEKALQRAAGLCSQQEQCSSGIREKLRLWKVSEPNIEKIIRKLKEEKFIDDERFAGFYAKDKFRFNGWGRIRISHMLRQKKIGEEEIEDALSQISDEDWYGTCFELLRNKSATLQEKDPFKRRGKLFRFVAGRGFEPDLIYRALDQLEKERPGMK